MGLKNSHEDKIGTALYMAPEQIQGKKYGKKIDLYAAGIIMY
jgi:serine/threonine protein kinase